MKQRIPTSGFIVSAFLVIYVLVMSISTAASIARIMFIASPFLLIWMVISVLKSKTFTGNDLDEDEEWGYADKQKEGLGMF